MSELSIMFLVNRIVYNHDMIRVHMYMTVEYFIQENMMIKHQMFSFLSDIPLDLMFTVERGV